MKQVVIENPVLNSPYEEPKRHFYFTDEGITDKIVKSRRISSYFIPVPRPKKRGKQLVLDTQWTEDRIKGNKFINRVRERVAKWRVGGYVGITSVTRRLLGYWRNPGRERRLFFCQIEALETAIYLTEVASKYGDAWIENDLRKANDDANPLLFRIAFKMATGSGKLSSWRCSSRGTRSTSWPTRRTAGSLMPSSPSPLASPSETVSASCCPTIQATSTARSTSFPKTSARSSKRPRSSSPTFTPSSRAKRALPAR